MNEARALIGVIGGSGLYKIEGLEEIQELQIDTPFGVPSDKIVLGKIQNVPVAFLARHNRKHNLLPADVPYRANIYALKMLGVKYIISVTAVGSLQKEFRPMDFLIVDQFIDYTDGRLNTFFSKSGVTAHVPFSDPVCEYASKALYDSAMSVLPETRRVFATGTYVGINGPSYSTKAESHIYRKLGASVIGMTAVTEAKLAREAEIAYCCICMITDYDCWNESHDIVSSDLVMKNLLNCVNFAEKIVVSTIGALSQSQPISKAHSSLQHAIVTDLSQVPENQISNLYHIIRPYLKN